MKYRVEFYIAMQPDANAPSEFREISAPNMADATSYLRRALDDTLRTHPAAGPWMHVRSVKSASMFGKRARLLQRWWRRYR